MQHQANGRSGSRDQPEGQRQQSSPRITLNPVQAGLLADILLDARLELGQPARLIAWKAGMSEATLHQLEHANNRRPRLAYLMSLAAQLQVAPTRLSAVLQPLSEEQTRAITACLQANLPTLSDADLEQILEQLTTLTVAHVPTSGSHRTGGHRYDRPSWRSRRTA